ncbi:cell wall-binding repeat-containing protein [Clostridium sp. DJ247]|uniref:cell wall-binding repeat-containing protein n=1 Tax=Clostridium sp. DJ247 TaxID=2726188 RepID=UPI001626273D|nr:cell wall-binding repeat-containing protein [Clostridium sp. DJ247]MBC2581830.1 cell wall-binding repeat-containing protein [Clostridium sp. DJ247]
MKKVFSLVAAAAITVNFTSLALAKGGYNVERLYGADRYKTSVSISNSYNKGEKLQNVIIASGKDFPDALAGSVLSKKLNAPIVLSNNNLSENTDTIQYIENNLDKSGTIYLLGGTASVSEEFIEHMKTLGYTNLVRLGGKDRFDTNKSIVNFMKVEKGTPIVIANAYGFADALSVSSIAASKGYPIIMTSNSSLSTEAKDMIKNINPSKVYIVGGYASVGDGVTAELSKLLPSLGSSNIIKLAGSTRYETSLAISEYFSTDTDTAVLANGTNFPDALSGSALASKLNAPILLTNGQDISNQKDFIDNKSFKNIILLGGFASIDIPVEYSLKGSDNITPEEKNYIDNLLSYSESYISKTKGITKYMEDISNEVMSESSLENTDDPSQLFSELDNFINIYNDCKATVETYKQDLITLRDSASNLQAQNGLEFLKEDYIKSINLDIESSDQAINLISSYIDIFNSLKDAASTGDVNKLQLTIQKLEETNSSNVDQANNLSSGETDIKKLKERLDVIKASMN